MSALKKPSPSLRDVQKFLLEFVTVTGGPQKAIPLAPPSWIMEASSGPTRRERLAIYAEGWYLRLEESLRDDYPALHRSLGLERWQAVVMTYMRKHPSRSFTLSRFGDALPDFLAATDAIPATRWQIDLAMLERAYYKARIAANPKPWALDELKKATPETVANLTFELQPGVSLLSSAWKINEFRLNKSLAKPENIPQRLLVYRKGLQRHVRSLEASEYDFLNNVAIGISLGEIIDTLEDPRWLSWLNQASASGLLRPARPPSA